MSTILAVFAHPDDETFICGGTLAKYANEGHKVILVCATKGEMGRRMGVPPMATRESIPFIREVELKNACYALGIEDLRLLGLRDKLVEIFPFHELTRMVLEKIEEVRPDAVITFHEVLGGHPDHCSIGLATTTAFRQYKEKNIDCYANLYYVCWSNIAGNPKQFGFEYNQITKIYVKPYNTQKLHAFRAHKTQSEMDKWLWNTDEISVNHFQAHEYFIHANGPFGNQLNSLI